MASLLRSSLAPKASDQPLPQFDLGPLSGPQGGASVTARSASPPANKPGRGALDAQTGTLAWVTRWENALLGRLTPSMRERVGRHRSAFLTGACVAGGVLLLGLGLGLRALAHGTHAPVARAAVTSKDSPELAATEAIQSHARVATPAAPAVKTADEPSVLLALAATLLEQHRDAEVPPLAGRLIARHPELVANAELDHVVLAAAASRDTRAATDAFALLTGPMGETGAALVYELSLKNDLNRSVRARAKSFLASKDFERVASLPVFAAEKLRSAKSCEDKRGLLDFAGQAGGTEVLDYLKELEHETSCGPDDLEHCYACLANDHRLADTIAKLAAR